MARRIRAREVLRPRSVNGLSQNAIARTAHVSKHSVQDVLEAARERVATRQAGRRVQVDAAGADGAEVRHRLDRLLHAVQEEGLTPEAQRRGPRRRGHGQDRAQRGLGRHGRDQHAAAPQADR